MALSVIGHIHPPTQARFRCMKNAVAHKMPKDGIKVPAFFKLLLMEGQCVQFGICKKGLEVFQIRIGIQSSLDNFELCIGYTP